MKDSTEKHPKKVLMIGMTTVFGGMERYIMNLFMGLDKNLYNVDFLNQEENMNLASEEKIINQGETVRKLG